MSATSTTTTTTTTTNTTNTNMALAVADAETTALAVEVAASNAVTWSTTTKGGKISDHSTATATGLLSAPKSVKVALATSADSCQLRNGNFTAVREALATFKGKALETIKADVTASLSVTDNDGNTLAPVVPWGNIRAKTHAMAVACAIFRLEGLKGKQAQWQAVMAAWVN